MDMLNHGASVKINDLNNAALARIDPNRGTEQLRERDWTIIEVARCGLAFLIERKARDGAAKARLSRRENDLRLSIRDYVEKREAHRHALKAERPASGKAKASAPAPRKAAGKKRDTSMAL